MPGGRSRKPDSVKAAQGTLQPCRSLEKLAATTTPELAPTPPVGLTKEARAAWKIAIEYAPKGLLVATDFTVLERWARNYALYRKLAKAVDHDGTTITVLKADGSTIKFMDNIYEFYNLGVEEVFAISALHGIGIGDMLDRYQLHYYRKKK